MSYIVIFLIAMALGILIGYLASMKDIEDNVEAYIHVVQDNDEPQPYIFLELKNSEELDKITDGKYIMLKTIRD